MKKILSALMSFMILIVFALPFDNNTVAFSFITSNKSTSSEETSATILIEKVNGIPGETISVPIRIDNNPGILALGLKISYDNKQMKLLEVTDGKILGSSVFTHSNNINSLPFILNWDDYGIINHTGNGIVAILKFQLSEEFQGEVPINLDLNQKATINADLDEVPFSTLDGNITCSLPIISTSSEVIVTSTTSNAAFPTESSVTQTTSTMLETSSQNTTTNNVIPSNASIVLDDIGSVAGEEIIVPIRLESNPGIIALSLNVFYDNKKMDLVRVIDERLFDKAIFTTSKNITSIPYVLNWDDDPNENNTQNGVVALLEFKIRENAIGESNIIIEPNHHSIFDKDFNEIPFAVKNANVNIISKGDVDCNGILNISDAVRLLKFISEIEGAELREKGYLTADLDMDSLYTINDVVMLLKILCGVRKEAEYFSFDQSNVTIYQSETHMINTSQIPQGAIIYWESSDAEIATVSEGVVRGIKPGYTQITAYFDYDGKRYSQICDLTVNPIEIEFENDEDTLYVNETLQLQVRTKPEKLDVFWSISDPSVISVTNGKITGRSSGQAYVYVTASYDGPPLSVSRKITVKNVEVNLSKEELSLVVGDSTSLSCETSPNEIIVSWTSSNNEIVSVKDGTINAIKPGKAEVTANISYKGKVYSASCTVTVTEPSLSLSSYADTANRDVWDSTYIPDGVACGWNVYYPQATYPKGGSIKWSLVSGNAYLQANRMIVTQPGTTTIRCTLTYKGYTVYKDYTYNLSLYKTPTETNALRASPSYDAARVGTVPGGETVVVTNVVVNGKPPESGSTFWGETAYNGTHGWIIISAWD